MFHSGRILGDQTVKRNMECQGLPWNAGLDPMGIRGGRLRHKTDVFCMWSWEGVKRSWELWTWPALQSPRREASRDASEGLTRLLEVERPTLTMGWAIPHGLGAQMEFKRTRQVDNWHSSLSGSWQQKQCGQLLQALASWPWWTVLLNCEPKSSLLH